VSVGSESAPLRVAELDAWRGLLRAHSALTKTLDGELEAEHALALSSYEVLLRLEAADQRRMRMCDLAESVLLSRSPVTRLVDRLERDGLVARDSCAQDARGSFAVLTDAGGLRLRPARATHIDGVRRHFLMRFSAAELEALAGLLARLAGESADAS
jgi:DNA-binding MarR family transcriptional regulator